ncbi:MAG TPA: sulfurtransferase TusA family protein [Pasteurellaceae bacterium]|nr:sulfurtransferase TusA family protein [Pasteurellaceae bacterium]
MGYQLDVTQFTCPLPLLMTKKALSKLDKGSILTLVINHNSAINDFKFLCEEEGYQLISVKKLTALSIQLMIQK